MKVLRTLALSATVCVVLSSQAEEFSWQLTGGVENSDVGNSANGDGATLGAAYFFRPVDDADGAYSLAPFLRRSSSLSARYDEDKTTSRAASVTFGGPFGLPRTPEPATTVVTRARGRALSVRYVWPTSGWYVGAGIASTDDAAPAPLSSTFTVTGDDVRSRSVTIGKYVLRSTTVDLTLDAARTGFRSVLPISCSTFFCPVGPPGEIVSTLDAELDSVSVSAMHVARLGRFQYSLSGGVTSNVTDIVTEIIFAPASATRIPPPPVASTPFTGAFAGGIAASDSRVRQRRERYALAGEIYPTPALGIRVGYARYGGDQVLDEDVELGATWFFRRKIGARITLARARTDLPIATVNDVDTATLAIIGRL
jgi:hypothetical protein